MGLLLTKRPLVLLPLPLEGRVWFRELGRKEGLLLKSLPLPLDLLEGKEGLFRWKDEEEDDDFDRCLAIDIVASIDD